MCDVTRKETARPVSFFATPFGRTTTALLTMVLWGSALPVTKLAYRALDISRSDVFLQFEFVGYRMVLGATLLLVPAIISTRSLPVLNRKAVYAVARIGLFQTFLQYLLIAVGVALSTGTEASLISGTLTFFQLGLAHLRYANDRMTARKVYAALIGFSGILLFNMLSYGSLSVPGPGEILMVVAMFMAAMGNLLSKEAAHSILPVLPLTGLQMLFGGLGLVAVGAWKTGVTPFYFSVESALILGYLSLVSAVGFFLWNSLMSHNRASEVSIYLFLSSIFGVVTSCIILDEPLTWYVAPSLLMITIGIVMAQRKAHPRNIPTPATD